MLLITDSTTVASQTNPVSPVHMASTSQTAKSNRQAMTAQPKLQKPLHAPPRNRKLTIPPAWAIRRPLTVTSSHTKEQGCQGSKPNIQLRWDCLHTLRQSKSGVGCRRCRARYVRLGGDLHSRSAHSWARPASSLHLQAQPACQPAAAGALVLDGAQQQRRCWHHHRHWFAC